MRESHGWSTSNTLACARTDLPVLTGQLGFTMAFLQGVSTDFHRNGVMCKSMNSNFIKLVPKKDRSIRVTGPLALRAVSMTL